MRATSPKINSFKWLLVHRSLATADRYREWLERRGGAHCAGCSGAVNTTEHVLFSCMAAQQLWAHLQACFRRHLGLTIHFTCTFVLLGIPGDEAQDKLVQFQWWETCRAIGLFTLWCSWTGRTFGGQRRLSLVAILHCMWHNLWERGQELHARSRKNFIFEQWQPPGVCSGPQADPCWHQSAPRWWLQEAHLAGTLCDPFPLTAVPEAISDDIGTTAGSQVPLVHQDEMSACPVAA